MDWTFDGPEPDFTTFDLNGGDMWNFDMADGPLDFEPTDLDDLQASTLGSNPLSNSLQIDPALVSPESNGDDPFAAVGGNQKANEWRRQQRATVFMPHLKTELSMGSRMIFGQVTPPSSNTSGSPPIEPLDTIDPMAMMPLIDSPQLNPLELSTISPKQDAPPSSATLPATSSSKPSSKSASNGEKGAPSEAAPVKPKSKRGRKKKILAPAARDAQRARTLARNRAAAQRCRQRKKVEHAALEARARGLARDRAALHTLVGGLRDELLSLKGQMLRHASCADADSGVAAYVQQQREMLMRGMPEDASRPNGPATDEADEEFLRELGIDPKDPMGDMERIEEDDDEDEAEDEDEDESDDHDNDNDIDIEQDADGDSDSVSQIPVPETKRPLPESEATPLPQPRGSAGSKENVDASMAKRLRSRPRRTAKARGPA